MTQAPPDTHDAAAPPPPSEGPDRAWFAELNRTRLRVWEWGDPGAPAVICAHGAHDHGRMFDGFAPRIAALGYRVLAPDLRGHGDSGRLAHGYIWASTALDLALLAREAGAPVGFIGHSFGGGQVTFAAGVWPELARWVVNLDGLGPPADGFHDGEPSAFGEAVANSIEWSEKVLLGPPRWYSSVEEMQARRAQTNHRLPAEWIEHLVRHGSRPDEGGFVWKADPAFRTGMPGEFDIEFLYAEQSLVRSPMLVLTGSEEDSWTMRDEAEIAKRVAIMGARHGVIEGAGHYVHIEKPDEVAAAIAAFAREVDG